MTRATGTIYDRIGGGYATTRQADPRIVARINEALSGVRTVVNVGAGTGSYEPPQCVVAVEPSAVMAAQRAPGAAPCVLASAEALPFLDSAFDAALAVLTIHHWPDLAVGIRELMRVARRRLVILTADPALTREFWLIRRYLPEAAAIDDASLPALSRLAQLLPGARFEPVFVPHDCVDGFLGAFWRRPAAYLESTVRAGMSLLCRLEPAVLERGLTHLRAELEDGTWWRLFGELEALAEIDAGYRLVIWERP